MTEEVELPSQVAIRTFGEKEIYKYSGIVEMKEKIKKRVSQKNQKITQDKTLLQESCEINKYLSCPPRNILGTILEVN